MTLRMLLSHTAGYGYHFFNTALRDSDTPLPMTVESHLADPILFEPGTSWEYGVGHAISLFRLYFIRLTIVLL